MAFGGGSGRGAKIVLRRGTCLEASLLWQAAARLYRLRRQFLDRPPVAGSASSAGNTPETLWIQSGKDAVERVVRRDAVGQRQKRSVQVLFGFCEILEASLDLRPNPGLLLIRLINGNDRERVRQAQHRWWGCR